jgi:hypothetical protein
MKLRNQLAAGAAGVLLFCLSGAGLGQSAAPSLTEAQVAAKLKAAGYINVHDVELEGRHFDAEATKDGKPVHLHVDARTGAIHPVANESEEDEEAEEHERHEHTSP